MKLCVFSDIHGNLHAFQAAYPMILAEAADINIFLGDLCGYYYDQLEIFPKLLSIPNLVAILGNHDRLFRLILRGDKRLQGKYQRRYGSSMDALISSNHRVLSNWLQTLPVTYGNDDERIACYHGSPMKPLDGYVYPDSPLDFIRHLPESILLLGHTHYKMHRNSDDKLIINPGSLGQPRDGGWPTYAVIDTATRKVSFREVTYDLKGLTTEIIKHRETNKYLMKVLTRPFAE